MASEPYLGAVFIFAGNFAPAGFQLCQGQILAISQNAALFSILGTTYGGDGQTTFALPDLQGRAPIGAGTGAGQTIVLGEASGAPSVTLLSSNLPVHTHTFAVPANSGGPTTRTPTGAFLAAPLRNSPELYAASSNVSMGAGNTGSAGGSQPVSTQSPYLGVNYIIALVGIFPSRN